MKELNEIEEKTVTLQQEVAFKEYEKQVEKFGREPSDSDFQDFYSAWCVEQGRFNDINQSNFEPEPKK